MCDMLGPLYGPYVADTGRDGIDERVFRFGLRLSF